MPTTATVQRATAVTLTALSAALLLSWLAPEANPALVFAGLLYVLARVSLIAA
jgi:hypothetical protein